MVLLPNVLYPPRYHHSGADTASAPFYLYGDRNALAVGHTRSFARNIPHRSEQVAIPAYIDFLDGSVDG
jgi:hypothetical protein